MKKIIIEVCILLLGVILILFSLTSKSNLTIDLLLSLGTGVTASSLTAGLIDWSNYLEFSKKKKYRRKLELSRLSSSMLLVAQGTLKEWGNKDIYDLVQKLSQLTITKENENDIILAIEAPRKYILKEIEAIQQTQGFLSLSQFFTDQEITFLCRSVNFYHSSVSTSNVNFVIENVREYLEMFSDAF